MDPKERRKFALDFFLNNKIIVNKDNLYRPRDGDIIVVGPMKSGTTWMQQILHQIRTKGDESFYDIYTVSWVMLNPKRQLDYNLNADQKFTPRLFKSHEAFGEIDITEKQKVVVIIRDPYDAAYSMAKFISGFYGEKDPLSEQETADLMIGMYEKNASTNYNVIPSWWEHRNDPNVLLVFYEDLNRNPKAMIKKISEFVEIPLTEEEFEKVCYLCSFEYMSKHKEMFYGEGYIEQFSRLTGLEKWTPTIGMVRTDGGKIGQGTNNLAPRLRNWVDEVWNNTMQKTYGIESYQKLYEQYGIFSKK